MKYNKDFVKLEALLTGAIFSQSNSCRGFGIRPFPVPVSILFYLTIYYTTHSLLFCLSFLFNLIFGFFLLWKKNKYFFVFLCFSLIFDQHIFTVVIYDFIEFFYTRYERGCCVCFFFYLGNIWWRCARDANNLEVPGL